MKKIFTFLLVLMATSSLWAYDFQSNGLYYNIISASAVEVTYQSQFSSSNYEGMTSITIPQTITNNGTTYSITRIGVYAFNYCRNLTSITIPEGVAYIDYGAFEYCDSLKSISIPNSIIYISPDAFQYSGISSNPDNYDEYGVFYVDNCLISAPNSLSGNYSIKDNTRLITTEAFHQCHALAGVTLPNSVTTIGSSAFSSCSSLKSITLSNGVTSIGYKAFSQCSSLTSITLPNSVTNIGAWAFEGCSSLTSITIPVNVATIGSYAFGYCRSLTSVVWNARQCESPEYEPIFGDGQSTPPVTSFIFGEEVEYIPYRLCYNMSKLSSVTIPKNVKKIEKLVFENCTSLLSVTWNAKSCVGLEDTDDYYGVFGSNDNPASIVSLVFGGEVEYIPAYLCRYATNIISITIPKSVKSIGEGAFNSCYSLSKTSYTGSIADWCDIKFENSSSNPIIYSHNLYINNKEVKDLVIPNGVDSVHNYAFAKCSSLNSVTIPSSVKSVGYAAFSSCSNLKTITISDGLTNIEEEAFSQCSGLTSITIPNSVTTIGEDAFAYCSGLTSIEIPNSVTTIREGAFEFCSSLTYLSIPSDCVFESFRYDGSLYPGGYSIIYGCYNLQTLIAPARLFELEEGSYNEEAFYIKQVLSSKLETLIINSGELPQLGWDWIAQNSKTIKTIDLAATTNTSIAEKAFYDCYKLENLSLPSQLEYIPYMAVAECVKLQAITIPATVTEIEDRAFENCRTLKSVIFEGSEAPQGAAHYAPATGSVLWRIGSWAFYNCHQLEHLNIPEGVTEVGDAAFYGCTYLVDMTLPSTVQEIGDNGFALCAKLQKIHVKATTPPAIQAKTFFDVNRRIPVYVPEEAVDAYKSDLYWQEFDIQGESNAPAAVSDIHYPITDIRKEFRDGQFIIIRDGVEYNAQGTTL